MIVKIETKILTDFIVDLISGENVRKEDLSIDCCKGYGVI